MSDKEKLKSYINDVADYLENRLNQTTNTELKCSYQKVVDDLDETLEELEVEIEEEK